MSGDILHLLVVSIHATLAGGDWTLTQYGHSKKKVSIPATLAGGDGDADKAQEVLKRVSIHATLAGGDFRI